MAVLVIKMVNNHVEFRMDGQLMNDAQVPQLTGALRDVFGIKRNRR